MKIPDDIMDRRRQEQQALIPKPSCCKRAKLFVRLYPDGQWYGIAHLPMSDIERGRISFCPCCGTKLPAVRRKAVQAPTLCINDDDYCGTCGDRMGCWCDPMESAFEIVEKENEQ